MTSSESDREKLRSELKALQKERERIEEDIKQVRNTIPVEFRDVSRPPHYVDKDGFPRADIDVWSVNESRRKLLTLQTDYKMIMRKLEPMLGQLFSIGSGSETTGMSDSSVVSESAPKSDSDDAKSSSAGATRPSSSSSPASAPSASSSLSSALRPFFRVDSVMDGSPASECGLKSGDLVIQFGSMTADTQSDDALRSIVMSSVGRPIPVTVQRIPEGYAQLSLVPRKWEGRGLLGCHLVPHS